MSLTRFLSSRSGLIMAAAVSFASAASAQLGPPLLRAGFEGSTPFANVPVLGSYPAITISRIGDTGTMAASYGIPATQGSQVALLTTFSDGGGSYAPGAPLFGGPGAIAGSNAMWSFLFPGSPTNALTPLNAVGGSMISFQLSLRAGERFQIDWRYLTSEASFSDLAFVGVRSGATGDPGLFANITPAEATLTAISGGATNFDYWSDWSTFTFTAPAPAIYTIGFGVADVFTEEVQSGIAFDNLVVIPEPSTWAVIIGSIVLAAALIRRRR